MVHANALLTPRGRLALARCVVENGWSLRRAAERSQTSPQTAGRWAARYRARDLTRPAIEAMADRSSRPRRCPRQTRAETARGICHLRRDPRLGAARIGHRLGMNPSTVGRVLARAGMPPLAHPPTWRGVTAAYERFAAAGEYLFSVPMWNASEPYKLRQLIDLVSQPGMVFSFDPVEGYTGLLTGRKAAVLYTGAIYGEGRGPAFGADFQAPFFRDWLEWIGIRDVSEVAFHPNIATADPDAMREVARHETRQLAKAF